MGGGKKYFPEMRRPVPCARPGCRDLRPDFAQRARSTQVLMTAMPQPSKSDIFLVASLASRDRVIAAICASNWLMGRPVRCRLDKL